jgi:hypothetical protein
MGPGDSLLDAILQLSTVSSLARHHVEARYVFFYTPALDGMSLSPRV